MTKARVYPKADAETQWWEGNFDRGTFSIIEKILLHTTETEGWPGYGGGATAPSITYHCRQRKWRQHNFINRSARALADPSATVVKENRDNVIQIEIICYADEKMAASVGGLAASKLTDDNLRDLAEFIVWVRKEWGGPPKVAAKMAPYPESYGDNAYRLSGPEYDAFRGILGHSNAPAGDSWGNRHGDPGSLNVARIMQLVDEIESGTQAPDPVEDDDMKFSDVIPGTNPPVTVGQALVRGDYAYQAVIEGGAVDKRLDAAAAQIKQVQAALAADDVATAMEILDRIDVSLTVKPE